eukprot:520246-Ditylum_brightwellii.AAC.1
MERSKAAKASKKTRFSSSSMHTSSDKNNTEDNFPADTDITFTCNTMNPPNHNESSHDDSENSDGSTNSTNNYFHNLSDLYNQDKDDDAVSSSTNASASNESVTISFSSLCLQFPTHLKKDQVIAKPLIYTRDDSPIH